MNYLQAILHCPRFEFASVGRRKFFRNDDFPDIPLRVEVDRSVRHYLDLKVLQPEIVASFEISLHIFGDQIGEKASSNDAEV